MRNIRDPRVTFTTVITNVDVRSFHVNDLRLGFSSTDLWVFERMYVQVAKHVAQRYDSNLAESVTRDRMKPDCIRAQDQERERLSARDFCFETEIAERLNGDRCRNAEACARLRALCSRETVFVKNAIGSDRTQLNDAMSEAMQAWHCYQHADETSKPEKV